MGEDYKLCSCGCMGKIPRLNKEGKERFWVHGHHQKGKNNNFHGKKHSEETKDIMSKKAKKNYKLGKRTVWSEGLSKDNSLKVRTLGEKISKTRKKLIKQGKLLVWGHGKPKMILLGKDNGFYGKKHSEETRKKMSENHANYNGSKNPNWVVGEKYFPYTATYTKEFRKSIRERDNYNCLRCGIYQSKELERNGKSLAVHHINGDKTLSTFENCCSLCNSCHITIHRNKIPIGFLQSILSERYGYKYKNKEMVIEC